MKIFVGHSFAEGDEALVNTIISFIAKRGITPETGEKAQNKSVSEKVKILIDRNDVFLGIFTLDQQIKQIEEVKAPKSFLAKFIPMKEPVSKINPPIFTTSNWVLQESGYAIAKGKKIIMMVENGIYKFPELQGDSEIIFFDRTSLDKPFLKLIEMLVGDFQVSSVGVQAGSSPTDSNENSNKEVVESKPSFEEMFDAHEEKDMKKVEEVYQKNVRPNLGAEQQKLWDAVLLRWQYSAGEAHKFIELEKMYNETKIYNVGVQLGICYEEFDKNKEAREVYLKCLQHNTDTADKFDCYLRIANCFLKEKNFEEAINTLFEAVNNPLFSRQKEKAFLDLVKIAEEKKDDYLYFVFAEKALDINPVNADLRFNVAYKYSNTNKKDLALYHYKKLLEVEENDMGLNNIGVAYSELDMEAKAVKFYEKASNRKNTLAYANLANKYLNAGFIDTAEKLLIGADELSKENIKVHENIGYSKKALKDKIDAEDKKENEVLAKAVQAYNFKIRHAEAFCGPLSNVIDLSGKWMLGEWGEIEVSWNRKDGRFTAIISKDFTAPSYGLGLVGLGIPATTDKTRIIELNGSIHNLAGTFTLKVRESIKGASPTLLATGLDEVYNSSGLLIVNVSGNQIDVMEEVANKERIYNQYKKVL